MIERIVLLNLCVGAVLSAQHRFDNALNVIFPNGVLRVHTESTSTVSAYRLGGVVAKAEGDISHRIVLDRSSEGLFAYDLLLVPNGPGLYTVRAVPAMSEYPTIAAARDFPRVGVGDSVTLEVLSDPSTGEKLFDVIEAVKPAGETQRRPKPEQEISLQDIQLSINGDVVGRLTNTWGIGVAVKIAIPGIGDIFLTRTPVEPYSFQEVGSVSGRTLSFPVGRDQVEIVSTSNILKRSETGSVWVYFDPQSPRGRTVALEVGFPEDLLPGPR